MQELFMEVVRAVIIATILAVLGLGGWQRWWKKKSDASVGLAKMILQRLDGDLGHKTTELQRTAKQLSESLISNFRDKVPHDATLEKDALTLIADILAEAKPIITELAVADKELDNLKRAIMEFEKAIRKQNLILSHLCSPSRSPSLHQGHVKDQLLDINTEPHDLLEAAKGEATIFLRGYGIAWWYRRKIMRATKLKFRPEFEEKVNKEYRATLQRISLSKAKT